MNKILLFAATFCLLTCGVFAQSTVFLYQGKLDTNGVPYSGSAEFEFVLWDAAANGNSIATNNAGSIITNVANGIFTVALDFGINPFNGDARFLETSVRTAIGPFTTLAPRQPLTATPYALRALNLTTNGLVAGTYGNALTLNNAANAFSGTFTGNGVTISNVNALTLGGVSSTGFWATNGNTGANPTNGAFLGNRDNLPLELRVAGFRVLRIEPGSNGAPNIIAGSPRNFVGTNVSGATIGGGGGTNQSFVSTNFVQADFGTVGGGDGNQIGRIGFAGTIGGGQGNSLNGAYNTVSGGTDNILTTNSFSSTISGGVDNEIDGAFNQLQGGENSSTIAGGADNQIGVVPFFPISHSQFGYNTISGGAGNHIYALSAFSTIAGGAGNLIETNANESTIGGGTDNDIGMNSTNNVIGGGNQNTILSGSSFATIPGGESNNATTYAFAAGRRAQAVNQGSFVWADSQNADFASTANNQFLIRASGGVGIGTGSPTRELEVQHSGDTEIGIKSTDIGGHLWTLQSSSVSGSSSNLDASFQIIDRTANGSRFLITTNGNVGIGNNNPTNRLQVNGGITCTALVQTSDRNAKENFAPISPEEVLTKVAALPLSTWTYKEMRDGRHLGPMAQDFYAAFQLGGGDTTITAIDTEGVALAAIQGLNRKLQEESKAKDEEIADLKTRLERLEQFMAKAGAGGR